MASTDTAERAAKAAADAIKSGKTPEPKAEGPKAEGPKVTEVKAETIAEGPARMASAPEGTCGLPVMTKDGAKPCLKEPHEASVAHSSRKYAKVSLEGLTPEAFAPEAFGADEELEQITDVTERGELQTKVDQQVSDAHAEWVKAGKPATFPGAIKAGVAKRYFIEPSQAEAYRTLLRSAGRFHHVRVKIAPAQKHTSGRTMLPWMVMDQREKAGTAKSA